MPVQVRSSFIRGPRSVALAVAAVWLASGVPAWAGDGGGEFVGPLQKVLDDTCSMFNVTNCPKLGTANQLVVELAALLNTTPNDIRNNALPFARVPPGGAVDGGSHGGIVTPLAFISPPNKSGPPVPTQPNDPAANSFIFASTSNGTVNFTFDYLPRTISPFNSGQVGDIGLPVAVEDSNGKLLRTISADLQIFGAGGPCPGFSAPGFEFDTTNSLFYGIDPVPTTFLTASFLNDANDPPAVNVHLAIARNGDTVMSSPGLPEPSTLALLGSGFVGLGLASWLRRRSTSAGSAVP